MQSRRTSYTKVALMCAMCCVFVMSMAPRTFAEPMPIADSPVDVDAPSEVAPTITQSTVPATASPTMFVFLHDLRLGAVSEDVRQLQIYLNTHGFSVSTIGPGSRGNETIRFGAATRRALAAFQYDKHITPAVGVLGPITRTYINGAANLTCQIDSALEMALQTTLRRGDNRIEVQTLQRYLNTHGYMIAGSTAGSIGKETTFFGAGTQFALRRFQKDNNIGVITGVFDDETRNFIRQKLCTTVVNTGVKKPVVYVNVRHSITDQEIGITVPVQGAIPATTIESTDQYTASIVWQNSPIVFSGNTSYIAVITITPRRGFVLSSIPKNFFSVVGAVSTTNAQGSGVITAIFPPTETIPLTVSDPVLTLSKPYDANTSATVTPGVLSGVVAGDDVSVSAIATYDSASVGTNKTVTVTYTLDGANAANYIKPTDFVVTTGEISSIPIDAPTLNIESPAPGATPISSIDNPEYSAVIAWENNPIVFSPGTSYTATITLTPKEPYTTVGLPVDFFSVPSAVARYEAGGNTVVAVFPPTGTIALTISDPTVTLSKQYDETTSAAVTLGILTGVVVGDDVSVAVTATYDTPLLGTGKTITVTYALSGAQSTNYVKPADYTVTTGEIVAAEALVSPSFTPTTSRIPLTLAHTDSIDPVGTSVEIINPTAGSTVYYTTDGTDPTTSSAQYTTPMLINSDTTVKAVAVKYGHLDSPITSSTYTINKSTTSSFSWPHGTVQVGNKFYLATRTNPSTITVFNDPNDLTNSQTVTLTGHQNVDSMIYDSVHNKLYANAYDAAFYQGARKTTILQIDPDNIANWSMVYDEGVVLYTDGPFPIVTDGTYVYGATYAWTGPSKFFKIRISDWTRVAVRNWTSRIAAHSATLIQYSDRSEMYVTNIFGNLVVNTPQPTTFAKVNLSDLSYTNLSLGLTSTGNTGTTDDMACSYVNDSGATCYAVSDQTMVREVGYKIDTATMTVTEFSINNEGSYGSYVYNNDLYVLDSLNKIIRYKNLDTTTPEVFAIPSITPNEFFTSSDGKLFVSDWKSPSQLIEFRLSS